jgi:hypothetical protein
MLYSALVFLIIALVAGMLGSESWPLLRRKWPESASSSS